MKTTISTILCALVLATSLSPREVTSNDIQREYENIKATLSNKHFKAGASEALTYVGGLEYLISCYTFYRLKRYGTVDSKHLYKFLRRYHLALILGIPIAAGMNGLKRMNENTYF